MKRISGIAILFILSVQLFAQSPDRPKQPDFPGDLLLDFGFNFWTEQPDNLPTHMWGSNSFGIYYNHRMRISDYLSFYPAAGFTFDKFAFKDDFTWLRAADGTISLDTLTGVSLTKNKISSTYFEIPLELRIHPFETVKGEGFFIGLGAVGGFRIGTHTKIKYDLDDETYKEKLYDSFGINRFRYGVQARLGFKAFHFFGKMYLNDLFESAPGDGAANPRVFTVGASFSGF